MANPGTTHSCGIILAEKTNLYDFLHFRLGDIFKEYFLLVLLLLSHNISYASTLAIYPITGGTTLTPAAQATCRVIVSSDSEYIAGSAVQAPDIVGTPQGTVYISCTINTDNLPTAVGAQCSPAGSPYNGLVVTSWTGDDWICGPLVCTPPLVLDVTNTQCVSEPVDTCPQVKALTALPADDACAQALENLKTTQAQKDAACGTLSTAMKAGKSCLEKKLSNTNDLDTGEPIPLKVTADIRDIAYQAHLLDVWMKMQELVKLTKNDPVMKTACAARRAEIAAEKGCDNAGPCETCYDESATQRSHCLKHIPASPNPNDAKHTQGNAIDVSEDNTITPLQDVLDARKPPQDIQQFLDAAPDCKLKWGGNFTDSDLVHFQVK